jgi:hypothetical protein
MEEIINSGAIENNENSYNSPTEQASSTPQNNFSLIKLLQVQTGEGEIEQYRISPLCFDQSEGLGQILRGISGFLGSDILRLAILDLIIGTMKWIKSIRKPMAVNQNVSQL